MNDVAGEQEVDEDEEIHFYLFSFVDELHLVYQKEHHH
jgi:hypothetical protein